MRLYTRRVALQRLAYKLLRCGKVPLCLFVYFGATEEAESYEANIFGQKATVSVTAEDGAVSAIKMDFVSVDTGSVLNAVAEQLGQDGETKDGVTTWSSGDRTVTLTEGDSGCTLEIK